MKFSIVNPCFNERNTIEEILSVWRLAHINKANNQNHDYSPRGTRDILSKRPSHKRGTGNLQCRRVARLRQLSSGKRVFAKGDRLLLLRTVKRGLGSVQASQTEVRWCHLANRLRMDAVAGSQFPQARLSISTTASVVVALP
jgi:hypothetical protein